ncbi:hypothetical protein SE17_20000 [Kouleothrix aurantiaca]|jgi:serine/threonine-protein kinase RsbW|uniref:Histidine kinase/HSP90-like ATPase domain-containing protein n=1 Tax=Kouleothrix aurantiaca TaxID=186479 RepID=A0A0N8PS39_9CHLR|nr:hypothetical protein SE17_20000 [Kouleothrix aurantiaca]
MSQATTLLRLQILAEHQYLNVLGACINGLIERLDDIDEAEVLSYNVQLGVNEIFANIVDHAYAGEAGHWVDIVFSLQGDPRQFIIELHDSGCEFEPDCVAAPNLDNIQIRGYGLFLAEQLMEQVEYQRRPDGNHWQLAKHL